MSLLNSIKIRRHNFFQYFSENNYVLYLFALSFIIVFLKSFFKKTNYTANFFSNELINKIIIVISNTQISVIILYGLYFLFVYIVFIITKFFSKNPSFKKLLISLMSISILGIIAHTITIPLVFFENNFIKYIYYFFYILSFLFSIFSIKNTQDISIIKSTTSILIALIPFFLCGYVLVICPYILFLNI